MPSLWPNRADLKSDEESAMPVGPISQYADRTLGPASRAFAPTHELENRPILAPPAPLAAPSNPQATGMTHTSPPSIIGATENRRDRLCADILALSIVCSIFIGADFVPFSARFDSFWRPRYDKIAASSSRPIIFLGAMPRSSSRLQRRIASPRFMLCLNSWRPVAS
jgi:hypothetical protein